MQIGIMNLEGKSGEQIFLLQSTRLLASSKIRPSFY